MVTKSKRERKASISDRERKSLINQSVVVMAILIAGVTLQFVLGPFDKRIIAFPINLIFFALPFLALLLKRGKVLRTLSSGSLSVILLVATTLISLWMGLVPGNRAQISWPFVLLYLLLLINLSAVIAVRLKRRSLKEIPFLLNHLGLLVALLAAGPGSADKERWMMSVNEGEVEWRAKPSTGKVTIQPTELPIAIELEKFEMEEYPPKIGIVNRHSGEALPEGKPRFYNAIVGESFTIDRWTLQVDSTVDKLRTAPAAYVRVIAGETSPPSRSSSGCGDCDGCDDKDDDITVAADSIALEQLEGWVSCGNYFQNYKILELNDTLGVAMTYPDPKQYRSKIKVYLQKGDDAKMKEGIVEVNRPLSMGGWRIYQYSYDTTMGRDSTFSTFELVYDPWQRATFWGLIMMIIGAATLFWEGNRAGQPRAEKSKKGEE